VSTKPISSSSEVHMNFSVQSAKCAVQSAILAGKDRYLTVKSIIPELIGTFRYILIYQQENLTF